MVTVTVDEDARRVTTRFEDGAPDPALAANEEALVLLLQKVANQGIGAVFEETLGAR